MTIWIPDLDRLAGPRYRAIADALAEDIRAGALKPGARMPTHRDLAWHLKVTVGTVSRAYAEAERRGLISGEVGRGTFVRGMETPAPRQAGAPPDLIDLAVLLLPQGEAPRELARTLQEVAAGGDLDALVRYQPPAGRSEHRAAGACWLRGHGVPAETENIIVTCGGHHGISLALDAFAGPGDAIAAEAMSYVGLKPICRQRRLRLEGISCDTEGLLPESLAGLCRSAPIRFLYLVPNLQNPLGSVLSRVRRDAVVEIARRHDILIIEDDIFSFLMTEAPPSFAELAPERTIHVASLSKCASPGLRLGWVLAPQTHLDRLVAALNTDLWMAPPLMAEIASRWVWDGTLARLATAKREDAPSRLAIARRLFGNRFAAYPNAYHFWLPLPESWHAADFAAAARQRGVAVLSGDAFALERSAPINGVRICLGATDDKAVLESGLTTLAKLLNDAPDTGLPIV